MEESKWKNFSLMQVERIFLHLHSRWTGNLNLAHLNSFPNWKFNKQGSAMNKRGVNFRGRCTTYALPHYPPLPLQKIHCNSLRNFTLQRCTENVLQLNGAMMSHSIAIKENIQSYSAYLCFGVCYPLKPPEAFYQFSFSTTKLYISSIEISLFCV